MQVRAFERYIPLTQKVLLKFHKDPYRIMASIIIIICSCLMLALFI